MHKTSTGLERKKQSKAASALLAENNKLKNICNETVFSQEYFIDNNEKVKYYTGLPNYNALMAVFRFLEDHIPITERNLLSKFQLLILTIIKLRISISVQDISYRFKVCWWTWLFSVDE